MTRIIIEVDYGLYKKDADVQAACDILIETLRAASAPESEAPKSTRKKASRKKAPTKKPVEEELEDELEDELEEEEKPKRTRKKATKKKASRKKAPAKKKKPVEEEEEDVPPTDQDVRDAINERVKHEGGRKTGVAAAKAILAEWDGAETVEDLYEEDYADVIEALLDFEEE